MFCVLRSRGLAPELISVTERHCLGQGFDDKRRQKETIPYRPI